MLKNGPIKKCYMKNQPVRGKVSGHICPDKCVGTKKSCVGTKKYGTFFIKFDRNLGIMSEKVYSPRFVSIPRLYFILKGGVILKEVL